MINLAGGRGGKGGRGKGGKISTRISVWLWRCTYWTPHPSARYLVTASSMENGRVWKELKALAAGAQDLAQDDADETPAIEPEEHMEVKGSKLCDGDARLQRRHGDLLVLGSEVGTARARTWPAAHSGREQIKVR
jgi:hypothetical protein